jgi:TRAP-type C4-dicarboxylate transport system permease small subunit
MLGVLAFFTVLDVFLRYAFSAPITGTTELSEFMMVIVVFPALAWAALGRKHVRVDLLVSHFPRRTQLIIDSVTLILALSTYSVMVWQTFLESMGVGTETSLLRLPHAPFYWILTVSVALFCLSIIVLIIENVTQVTKR